jgi:hypothetical protein
MMVRLHTQNTITGNHTADIRGKIATNFNVYRVTALRVCGLNVGEAIQEYNLNDGSTGMWVCGLNNRLKNLPLAEIDGSTRPRAECVDLVNSFCVYQLWLINDYRLSPINDDVGERLKNYTFQAAPKRVSQIMSYSDFLTTS